MFQEYPKWLKSLRTKAIEFFQKYSIPTWLVFVMDNVAVIFSFFIAYLLRFNFVPGDFSLWHASHHAFIATSVYAFFSLVTRAHTGLLRHTTIVDIFNVLVSTTSSVIFLIVLSLLARWIGWGENLILPISILLIHYVIITLMLFVVRIIIKIIFILLTRNSGKKERILIYGAGEMGVTVKRVIDSDLKNNYQVAGYLDESKNLQGKKLNDKPVYNPNVLSPSFLKKYKIDTLIIAVENITPNHKSEIIRKAIELDLDILETPPVEKWLNGQLQMRQIQKVNINDLLGRDPIKLNMDSIGKGLMGMTILVTGAAGSIGSEIVRQLARFTTKNILLLDQAETPMFHLNNELTASYGNLEFKPILGDVTNPGKMEQVFREFHPDIVFHAAAYKHVPLMEDNPHEAFRVNMGGTKLITGLAVKYEVKKFVMISTDKSVNPTNVMGASKRACEMIVQSRAQQPGIKTQFVITRFGNVLGSNGSVVPVFSQQIEKGGPVTVTHPDISRYFMTIPEACELVLEAGFMGKGGEIFVFDMGLPIKIADLANQMVLLSGLVPGKDIKIEYIGLRPGEKLHEELLSIFEITLPTHHPKIKIARTEILDYDSVMKKIETLLKNLPLLSKHEAVELLKGIVPEYNSSNGLYRGKDAPPQPLPRDGGASTRLNDV